jgi:hypothetical protein
MIEYYMWTASQTDLSKRKKNQVNKRLLFWPINSFFLNNTNKDVSHENSRVLILQSYVHA